jgi:hypothetical protein
MWPPRSTAGRVEANLGFAGLRTDEAQKALRLLGDRPPVVQGLKRRDLQAGLTPGPGRDPPRRAEDAVHGVPDCAPGPGGSGTGRTGRMKRVRSACDRSRLSYSGGIEAGPACPDGGEERRAGRAARRRARRETPAGGDGSGSPHRSGGSIPTTSACPGPWRDRTPPGIGARPRRPDSRHRVVRRARPRRSSAVPHR